MPMQLVYWKINNARGTLPVLIDAYAGGDMVWDDATANKWPATKKESPFGQLPYLKDGDVILGQSMAIARYLGKKHGLVPIKNLQKYGKTEMLVAEYDDIFSQMVKCKYGGEESKEKERYNKFFGEWLPDHFAKLSSLLEEKFFTGPVIMFGDVVIFAICEILRFCNEKKFQKALKSAPKLAAFYATVAGNQRIAAAVKELEKLNPYFANAD